jgi:hypothetical protein
MKRRYVVFLFLVSIATISVSAQTRTITNADLEKYRVERVEAERQLREDYAKLGFSSPEERARRDAQASQKLNDLAEKLRQERLESDRIEADREAAEGLAAVYSNPPNQVDSYYTDPYPAYFWSAGRRFSSPRVPVQQGYFAGGAFWPTGPRITPQPIRIHPRIRPRH